MLTELSIPWNSAQTDSLAQVIREAGPRYHFLRIYMLRRQEPCFDEALGVRRWLRPQLATAGPKEKM